MAENRIPASADEFNLTISTFTDTLLEMKDIHEKLFRSTRSIPEHEYLYTRDSVPVRSLEGGDIDISARIAVRRERMVLLPLLGAGTEFISKGLQAANQGRGAWSGGSADAWYVLNNGPNALAEAFNRSSSLAHQGTEAYFDTIDVVELGILGSSIGLLVVVILAVIVPITLAVEASKDQIFVLFLAVPSIVVRSLRTQSQRKLDQMLAQIEDDETLSDEDDDDEDDDDDDNDDQGGGSKVLGERGQLDWARMKLKERQREFKKSGLVYFRLLMQFTIPLVLFMGFYVGIFLWGRIVGARAKQDGNGVL